VDFDGDGKLDMVSGSYDPGDIWLFRGLGGGELEAGKVIRDEAGVALVHHPLQLVEYETRWMGGKDQSSQPALRARVASFGSWPCVLDWDGDGDLDVLIGSFAGDVWLRTNVGTRTQPRFAKESVPVLAAGKPLQVHGHAAPAAADWDGDGLVDLVVGADDGSVTWFKNAGTKEAPRLGAGQVLLPARAEDKFLVQYLQPDQGPGRGVRNQVHVADYDGDGKLDLLVGDYSSVRRLRAGLDADDRARLERVLARERELDASDAKAEAAEAKAPQDAAAVEERTQLANAKASFYESLGTQSFVWVYLRK